MASLIVSGTVSTLIKLSFVHSFANSKLSSMPIPFSRAERNPLLKLTKKKTLLGHIFHIRE